MLCVFRDELTVAASRLAVLDESLAAARRAIEDQKQSAVDIQSDSRAMADRIVSRLPSALLRGTPTAALVRCCLP